MYENPNPCNIYPQTNLTDYFGCMPKYVDKHHPFG